MEFSVDVDAEDAEYSGASKAQERTGRWTRIEHETFLNGLRVHGKVWKKVGAHNMRLYSFPLSIRPQLTKHAQMPAILVTAFSPRLPT
jgi:hypothetical protein